MKRTFRHVNEDEEETKLQSESPDQPPRKRIKTTVQHYLDEAQCSINMFNSLRPCPVCPQAPEFDPEQEVENVVSLRYVTENRRKVLEEKISHCNEIITNLQHELNLQQHMLDELQSSHNDLESDDDTDEPSLLISCTKCDLDAKLSTNTLKNAHCSECEAPFFNNDRIGFSCLQNHSEGDCHADLVCKSCAMHAICLVCQIAKCPTGEDIKCNSCFSRVCGDCADDLDYWKQNLMEDCLPVSTCTLCQETAKDFDENVRGLVEKRDDNVRMPCERELVIAHEGMSEDEGESEGLGEYHLKPYPPFHGGSDERGCFVHKFC